MKRLKLLGTVVILTLVAIISGSCTRPPMAEFEASITSGQAPLSIKFDNTSLNADEFHWDFGDGTTTTTSTAEESVIHEYIKVGTYTVTLTAIKNGEPRETSIVSLTISVKHGPLDRVKLSPQTIDLQIGQSQEFSVEVTDAYDNPITEAQITWEVAEGVGTITSDGVLTVGTMLGKFDDGIVVTAKLDTNSIEATASVTVYVLSEVTSLVGDKDGFGLGLTEGDKRAVDLGLFDNREPDDPLFTDVLPTPNVFSYEHDIDLGGETIVSAELSFFTFSVQDGDTQVVGSDVDIKLFLDGVEVDDAFDDLDQFTHDGSGWVEIVGSYTISIPESVLSVLLDGSAEVRIEILQLGTSGSYDSIAIDFSELTILTRTP